MGQRQSSISKRNNDSDPSSSTSAFSPESTGLASIVSDAGDPQLSGLRESTTISRRLRHRSIRKSVLGLIHSKSQENGRKEDVLLNDSTSSDRKKWRYSKRWSKTPIRVDTSTTSDAVVADHGSIDISMQPSESMSDGHSVKINNDKGKGKAMVQPEPLDAQQNDVDALPSISQTPAVSPSPLQEIVETVQTNEMRLENSAQQQDEATDQNTRSRSPRISDPNPVALAPLALAQNISESVPQVDLVTQEQLSMEDNANVVHLPSSVTGESNTSLPDPDSTRTFGSDSHTSVVEHSNNNPEDAPQNLSSRVEQQPQSPRVQTPVQPSPQTRQFPPPGTLVVVQGVVHTTDTPRHSISDSAPNTSSSGNTTASNGASTSENDSSVTIPIVQENDNDESDSATPSRHLRNFQSGHGNSLLASLLRRRHSQNSSTAAGNIDVSPRQSDAGTQGSNTENNVNEGDLAGNGNDSQSRRPGQLSTNSIEVLGTLLSIATAATAASLVTGSSDSFFRSSHGNSIPGSSASTSESSSLGSSTVSSSSNTSDLGIGLPAIARALAAANPTAASAVARREQERQREREREDSERHRMRNVWASLRERLGRARTSGGQVAPARVRDNSSNLTEGTENNASTPDASNGLVSEALFNEIARAFNLGLNANGGTTPTPPNADSTAQEANTTNDNTQQQAQTNNTDALPVTTDESPSAAIPQDSFEHFLVNLQSDLRDALIRMDNGNGAGSNGTTSVNLDTSAEEVTIRNETESTQIIIDPNPSNLDRSPEITPPISSTIANGTTQSAERSDESSEQPANEALLDSLSPIEQPANVVPLSVIADASSQRTNDGMVNNTNAEPVVVEVVEDGETEDDIASLVLVSTSEDDETDDDDDESHSEGASEQNEDIIPTAQPIVSNTMATNSTDSSVQTSNVAGSTPASGNNFDSRGGINWWRMYRFPPMRMNQTHHQASANSETTTSPSLPIPMPSIGTSATTEIPASTSNSSSNQISPANLSSLPSSTAPRPQQQEQEQNTNMVVPVIVVGLQSINARERADNATSPQPSVQPGAEQVTPSQVDASPSANAETNWQTRAARAMSQLGRRSSPRESNETATEDQDSPGSRTFFIYVFGGYYPPNHHIVTGPNSLDSFEALWELAELLGQVKPPIATREDIEKSGLEIFKASSLPEYEATGKVASNCVDRCLVCLDDYEPDDDLRMMSCKHAFHKECVDKWLQTGRNNCPTCRGQGVNTENRPLGTT